ncbi:MAG: DUF4160 domain-containing protein [Leptotrichiaceae bacterium]|nr:DUF4160 domain-containing protein [Leptotrichiaceae bacterium]
MPSISRFLGIIITMYYREHNPPHFHVKYNEYKAIFTIEDLKMIEGDLPKRVVSLVLEWAFAHREELVEDWNLAVENKPLKNIEPLV